MTKRAKQNNTSVTSQEATKQLSESVEAKSNTRVAKTTKAPTNAPQKASTTKPRGRPKKVVTEKPVPPEGRGGQEYQMPAPVSKAIDVDSRNITYASAGNAVPSKYAQFKAWLVFKLYYYTSYFKGY